MNIKLTILIENYVPTSLGLTGEHGLSVLVEYNGKSYLFDTGQSGRALDNAFALKKEIKDIQSIILSHGHYDHAGGLLRFLKYLNRPVKINLHAKALEEKYVVNEKFGEKYIGFLNPPQYLEANYKAFFHVLGDFEKIDTGIYTLSNVPMKNGFEKVPEALKVKYDGQYYDDNFEDDLSLILESDKGLIVILGCAHRGMVNICQEAINRLNKNIYAVIGGTHTKDSDEKCLDFIISFIKDNDIKIFAPNHCTGLDKINYFKNTLPGIFRPAFCGSVLEL